MQYMCYFFLHFFRICADFWRLKNDGCIDIADRVSFCCNEETDLLEQNEA